MSGYVQSSAISEGHAVLGCLHPDSCNNKSVWNMRHMPRVPHALVLECNVYPRSAKPAHWAK